MRVRISPESQTLMDDLLLTCICGKHHIHLFSEKETCEKCQEMHKELEKDPEYKKAIETLKGKRSVKN